ncbi:FAD/NAD(P)-binding oxidoreductase [Acidiplasma cupricumulans]|uniref:FAD/NAD(P)-binding oxidoreductase n=1 Tax=Acidiplasma cupricumulans TaxID=312540 RepID=UPI000784CE80|nr:FAD/NAD(P)-binding oxidoreductase [Acidiplasma cupricumulans]
MDNIMILGSGYSGLNAYYRLRRKFNVKIITRDYYLNYYLFNNPVRIKLKDDIINEQVKDVNIEKREIITDKNVYNADKIIIATGCDRNNQITFLEKMKLENNMAIGSQNEFDEYIVINFILAMKNIIKILNFQAMPSLFLVKKFVMALLACLIIII